MASYGTAKLQPIPSILSIVVGSYMPTPGANLGAVTLFTFGGGGTPVEPKRFLKVGGVAVPIQ